MEKALTLREITDPNIFFDKIFIINLDSSPDRWNKICKNLNQFGIHNYERQPGVRLPRKNPQEFVPPLFYHRLEAYGGRFKSDSNYILNAVGTNLAHFNIFKKAKQRNYTKILVLEDDTFLNKRFKEHFSKGMSNLMTQNIPWDLIYLGFKRSRPQFQALKVNPFISRPTRFIRGAYAYALNIRAIDNLLKTKLFGGMEIDVFFEFFMLPTHRVFCFVPPIVSHRDALTSTITEHKWKRRNF